MIDKGQALLSLRPGANWTLDGNTLIWQDNTQTQPSDEEIQDEVNRLQTIEDSSAYKYQRMNEYPSISDQLDMLWHAIDNNTLDKTSNFYLTLKQVKDQYPKT
jgi:hypothetical protein